MKTQQIKTKIITATKFPTVKEIENWDLSIDEVIQKLNKIPGEKPVKPVEPRLKEKTSAAALQYAEDLQAYEIEKEAYESKLFVYRGDSQKAQELLVEYIKKAAGLDSVPEQYRQKVWDRAYSDGHSSGYAEVYIKLDDLIDIFR